MLNKDMYEMFTKAEAIPTYSEAVYKKLGLNQVGNHDGVKCTPEQ